MGKELKRIGAPFRQPEWSALALMEEPESVFEAHQNFMDAGAEVITTNSYAIVPFHIGQERFDDSVVELASLAGRMAREAADEAEQPVLVCGSLPPLFGSYLPELFDPELAPEMLDQLIEGLSPSVDLWLAETLGSVQEFDAVLDALDRHAEREGEALELWASFSLSDDLVDGKAVLRSGESIEVLLEAVADRADALLFNCSQPETISVGLGQLVAALGKRPLRFGAYANAFPGDDDPDADYAANEFIHEPRADLTPENYADIVEGWVETGASIVGGCCDIGPEHIAELVARFG